MERGKFGKLEVCNEKKLFVGRFQLCIESKINLIQVNWFHMKEKALRLDISCERTCMLVPKYYGSVMSKKRHKQKETAVLGIHPPHNHNLQSFLEQ